MYYYVIGQSQCCGNERRTPRDFWTAVACAIYMYAQCSIYFARAQREQLKTSTAYTF